MKIRTNRIVVALSCFFVGCSLLGPSCIELRAASSAYPNRPITLVIPYPAGGVTDLAGRVLAEAMEKHLKEPVVVLNKTGGRTTMGGYTVVTAKPDGYTLGFFPISAVLPEVLSYFFAAPYTSRDFKPISCIVGTGQSFVVKADAPWNGLADIVEFARKNPGFKVGSSGKHTLAYMVMAGVAKREKVSFVDVPFDGDAPTLVALLGGHIPVGGLDYSVAKSSVDAGKVKVLAVCTERRVDFAPSVPAIGELGYKLAYVSVVGLLGPKAMPNELVKKIDGVVGEISKEQEFRTKMKGICIQPYYQDTATYQESLMRYKEGMAAFFKEEGLVK